ncbi:acyl-CoA dehydrogenase family protein [Bordetella bronchiseptica]|uniref:acyl-CoA dehydrogenase family protein n=1 Tax=Bordetella bronchiseptica TaxID=518 RepID=UPI00081CEA76|nr:acyl-CoA dehydrogenase family protein [Bordetella bronchiseptica]AOB28368.1 acyl-CoA dehydrogenase [Bordetella bronchiseptica]AZW45712.1 acyl-CoA dehydrogenase [Bordetella bronchiseptica]
MASTMQQDLYETFVRALTGLCPLERVREIEAAADPRAAAAHTWNEVDALGYGDALSPAEHGGAGLSLADAEGLLRAAGAMALPFPFADTLLARALLRAVGQAVPDGPIALGVARPDGAAWRCAPIAGVALAQAVAVELDGCLLLWPTPDMVQPGLFRPVASGAPAWRGMPAHAGRAPVPAGAVQAWRNAADAAGMTGAMQAVLDRCVAYARERRQFGQALGRFQAIQQDISVLAEQVAAVATAARLACASGALFPDPALAACARLRACEAVPVVCALAHAVHGAIGITEELPLGLYTARLHEWRAVGTREDDCAELLGRRVLADDGRTLLDAVRGLVSAAQV